MFELLSVLIFLFVAILMAVGIGSFIYGCVMLVYSVIEIITIKLEELRELKRGNKNE